MVVRVPRTPGIQNSLRMRLAIDVDQHGLLLRGIEAFGLDHPRFNSHIISNAQLNEFRGLLDQRFDLFAQLLVAFQLAHHMMIRQSHQIGDRGTVELRVSVKRPLGIR